MRSSDDVALISMPDKDRGAYRRRVHSLLDDAEWAYAARDNLGASFDLLLDAVIDLVHVWLTLYSPALEPTPRITPPARTAAISSITEPAKRPSRSSRPSNIPHRPALAPLVGRREWTLGNLAAISNMTTDPGYVSLHSTHAYPTHQRAASVQRPPSVAVQSYRVPVSSITALARRPITDSLNGDTTGPRSLELTSQSPPDECSAEGTALAFEHEH